MPATVSTRAPRHSPARRVLFWIGVVLTAAGIAILAYFAWQLFGTNVVARHKQEQNVERLRESWARPGTTTAENGGLLLGEISALVRIPKFGNSYEMPVLEGTSDEVLSQGLSHFAATAPPGAVGNYALAGHRITHGEPLRKMPDLRRGDEVIVETRRAIYTYVLDTDPNELIVPFTASWVIDPFPVNPDGGPAPDPADGDALITLATCAELFHTEDRMVAFGHLQSTLMKPASRT